MNCFLKQKGTTLVEVLVAAVIIAVGLLGIASLQVKALQASGTAEQRARAIDLASALADRMRANLKLTSNSDDDSDEYLTSPIEACPGEAPDPYCASTFGSSAVTGETCTPQQMAAFDLYELRCADGFGIKKVLPEGSLTVTCADSDTTDSNNCTPGSHITISISWRTREEEVADTEDNLETITLTVIPGEEPNF